MNMSQRKIRVGLVGANPSRGWGGSMHGPVYQSLPETELVAVCTSRPETAKAAAERFGARYAFTDYREMVKSAEVDMVSVAIRVDMHLPIVMAALEAGKHVICEWPLALTSQEAQEMYNLASSKNLGHAVVLQGRCAPGILYLHDLIAQGYIGEPLAVTMTYFRNSGLGAKFSTSGRRINRGTGDSALDVATGHGVDALCYCFGELESLCADVDTLIKEATLTDTGERAKIEAPDNVAFVGRFRNGAMVTSLVSWTSNPPLGWQLHANGTEGSITVTRRSGSVRPSAPIILGARSGKVLQTGGQRLQRLPIPDQYNWTPEFEPETDVFHVAQLVRRTVQGFVEGAEVHPNFLDGLRLRRLLDAIERSSETRSWVKVEPGDVAAK